MDAEWPRVAVVIPALDEAGQIGEVLEALPWPRLDRVVVVDNGSRDATARIAREAGAVVVHEPWRGYGAACLAGIRAAANAEVIAFLDGDGADDPADLLRVVAPVAEGRADLAVGSRLAGPGAAALPPHARWGDRLAAAWLRRAYGLAATDLGPLRAIRTEALARLGMSDPAYGWTAEMQARAARAGLRVVEVAVGYRRRSGRSKVSGTLRGSAGAAWGILSTLARVAREPAYPWPPPLISAIVPTWNEAAYLGPCLEALGRQEGPLEIVVADGGSTDATLAVARRFPGVRVVHGRRGRGRQLNAGARAARGEILWMVHADCIAPPGAATAIRRALADPAVALCCLRFRLAGRRPAYRVVEAGVRLRTRLLRLPYGDQGLACRRRDLAACGGLTEGPLFEDLHLVRALRPFGRLAILPHPLPTSPRRCARDGVVRTTLRNQLLLAGERLGLPPERLARLRQPAACGSAPREPSTEPVEDAS